MSMQDPVSDMLTQIRNAQAVNKPSVTFAGSKLKEAILAVLQDEGYILGFDKEALQNNTTQLTVSLKYFEGKPVINEIKRISKPSLRVYRGKDEMPEVLNGMGICVVSTPKGVMTARHAQANNMGGELICSVT